jgi:serine/threonine-protein kinase
VVCSDYEIVRLVAAGVEGEVYETRHQLTGQPAMVKALPAPEIANTQADERIMSEARAMAKLDHPNLLTLYNFRREGSRYFAVLQIPGGQPLEGIIQVEGPLELPRFYRIFSQVLDALAYAHQVGLPHGQLTALNVAVDDDDRVKITGFDHFVKAEQEGQRSMATVRFLAPEQIRNHLADERTDLYAVGVLAYYALAGKVPFDGQADFDVMRAHLEEAPVDLRTVRPEIPEALWQLLDQALAKKAGARAPSAQAMLQALQASAGGQAAAPEPSGAQTSEQADAVAGSMSGAVARKPERTPDAGVAASLKRRYSDTKEMYTPRSVPKPAAASEPAPVSAHGTMLGQIQPVKLAVPKKDVAVKEAPAPVAAAPLADTGPPKVVVDPEPPVPAPAPAPPPVSRAPVVVPPLTAPPPVEPPQPTKLRSVEPPSVPAVPQLPDEHEAAPTQGAAPDITPAPSPVAPAPAPVKPAPVPPPKAEPVAEPAQKPLQKPEPKAETAEEQAAPAAEPVAEPRPASRADSLQTTPFGGLRIQEGGETEFFSTEQEFDDGHDDFSDLDDFQPKAQRKRRLLIGLLVVLVAVAAGAYFAIFQINPYAKAGDTKGAKRTDDHDRALLAQVYKEDPVLTGAPVSAAAGASKSGMTPAGMRPAGMTPAGMTPAGMTPAGMRPADMRPAGMTPGAMTPTAGGGEAAKLAAKAQKEYKRNRRKAEKLAEKALKLNPTEPTARKLLAKILGAKAKRLLHSGANRGAAAMASRATSLDGSLPGPWFYLGVAKNEMGKKAEAKAALTRFIQLCPKCGYNSNFAKQILKSIK